MKLNFNELNHAYTNLQNFIIKTSNFDPAWLKRYNILILCSLIKNSISNGNIVEVGCCWGGTTVLLRNYFNSNYNLTVYDSFEGLSQPNTYDMVGNSHVIKHNMACTIDITKNVVDSFCKENKNINYVKGWVDDTIPNNLPEQICFAHIDVDLYEPTYHSLKYIIPRMVTGGIIVIDDYEDPIWIGVKPACDLIEKEFNIKITRLNVPNSDSYQGVYQKL
jgi:O-methyltransferase